MTKTLTVSDGGHAFSVRLREDVSMPTTVERPRAPHMQFIDWWRKDCRRRDIPYPYTIAEPMGVRIVANLMKRYTLAELKSLATHFFLDHGDLIREDARHFAIFSSMVDTMKAELKDRG